MGQKDRSNINDAACDKKRELKVKGQYDIYRVTQDTAPTAAP